MQKLDFASELERFNYSAAAELFSTRHRNARRQPLEYKRFARASDAIRFAMEDLPPEFLVGTYLEVDEMRYESTAIRRLYERVEYPLTRAAAG